MKLAGWGNYPRLHCRVAELRDGAAPLPAEAPLIARGLGRAYGDAALQPNMTVITRRLDRLRAFDPRTGVLIAEAGVKLATLLDVFLPRGWLVPVMPGTRFVTLGGMVAADVHGKNHHQAGSFGRHVLGLELLLGDGRAVECGPAAHPDLFAATLGGMGLTGIIRTVTLRLERVPSAWIHAESRRAPTLEAALDQLAGSHSWPYTVAWIDGLDPRGRCLVSRGRAALPDELPPGTAPLALPARPARRVPLDLPSWALNRHSVAAFNAAYWRAAAAAPGLVPLDRFFFPLDAVLEWNRIYGPRGFTQYQCALPDASGLRPLLDRLRRAGAPSFLAVLKLFGPQPDGLLSFPMPGVTLALDVPLKAGTLALLDELDAIVADHGGRLYLAKDARTSPARLRQFYPRLGEFQAIRARWSAAGRLQSRLAERLEL